jgi:hypothetical protein
MVPLNYWLHSRHPAGPFVDQPTSSGRPLEVAVRERKLRRRQTTKKNRLLAREAVVAPVEVVLAVVVPAAAEETPPRKRLTKKNRLLAREVAVDQAAVVLVVAVPAEVGEKQLEHLTWKRSRNDLMRRLKRASLPVSKRMKGWLVIAKNWPKAVKTRPVRVKVVMLPVAVVAPVVVETLSEKQGKTIRGSQDTDRLKESLLRQ